MDLARFERATSTFAESRSYSAELQVRMNWYGHPLGGVSDPSILEPELPAARLSNRTQTLAEATGVEPAHAMRGDLVPTHRDCHTIRRRLQRLAEGTGVEPASNERGSFQDYCLTS